MYKSYDELGQGPNLNHDQYNVHEIKTPEERRKTIISHNVACIYIYADWCGPCKQIASPFSVLCDKYNRPGLCSMVKLNWDNVDKTERQQINGIPLFLIYYNGQLVDNVIGANLQELEEKIKKLLDQVLSSEEIRKGPQYMRNTIRSSRASDREEYFPPTRDPRGGVPDPRGRRL
jgi:thioredoxin 1